MAKYEVKFMCGHTQEIALFGPTKDRYRKIEWMQENCKCEDCKKAEFAAANEKAAADAKEAGYPELTGTPKQIAWAESIRKAKMDELKRMADAKRPRMIDKFGEEETEKEIKFIFDLFLTIIEASKWIDHRDDTLNELATKLKNNKI